MLVAALLAVVIASSTAVAEDTVVLNAPRAAPSRAKVMGRIVDYNGRELVLDIGGAEKRYPAEQVGNVETAWTPPQQAADELFARREFAAALAKYELALRGESRRWVQRRILAQMIWCLRNLDQYRRAGELFLALARDDPAMLHISCIPLRWLPAQPAADLDKAAHEWLASDAPVAVLLGASHLLATADRGKLVQKLEQVSTGKDPRLAALARALVWNATFASASPKQLSGWEDEIEAFPDEVRAGPYFALGRALAHHKQPERAALALLRVPLLYAEDGGLASVALFEAGRSLEQADQSAAAARVYRELIAEHPRSRPANEAQQRLDQVDAQSPARDTNN